MMDCTRYIHDVTPLLDFRQILATFERLERRVMKLEILLLRLADNNCVRVVAYVSSRQ